MKSVARALKFYGGVITECIPLFIAAGLLSAFSGSGGWLSGSQISRLPGLLHSMVIPVWMGHISGKKCGGDGGGMAGALAASAVVYSEPVTAMAAAAAAGAGAGFFFRIGMEKLEKRIPSGFEMLVRNLYLAAVGLASGFAVCCLLEPAAGWTGTAARLLYSGMRTWLVPFAGLAVEPLKILFLNNWLNHGFFVPLGMNEARTAGSSILFLLEANPGPGFGILAAHAIIFRGERGKMASNLVIQMFGGIHEIYFPYVLSNIGLLAAAVAGSIAGNTCFWLAGSGLSGPASPGSVITVLLMADRSKWLGLAAGIAVSAAASCLAACPILAWGRKREEGTHKVYKREERMRNVYFVCDAGMGSSAMASALFKRKLKAKGMEKDISVFHVAADYIPAEADVVVCQKNYAPCLPAVSARIFTVDSLTDTAAYDELLRQIAGGE